MTNHTPNLTPPPPRRTDDAFARAVRADVDATRTARKPWRLLLAAPLTAAMAFGLFAIASGDEQGPTPMTPATPDRVALFSADDGADDGADDSDSAAVDVAAVVDVVDDSDDDTLLAFAGDRVSSDLRPAFAFADLDGSTEQDLAAVEAALDRALTRL